MSKPVITAAEGGRPVELEDWLNRYLYHPLSLRLARLLSKTPITPNIVSITGGVAVVIAAIFYTSGMGPFAAAIGLLIHMGWHVLDGADGDLARLTGRDGPMGEIIDGASDYLSHLVLYIMLASVFAAEIGMIGWALMIGAGFARAAQTTFYETQRRQYQWWVYQKPWLRNSSPTQSQRTGILFALTRIYMAQ